MKIFISILILAFTTQIGFSQNNDYSKLWKEVNKLEQDGLPKSALEKLTEIEKLAKTDKNEPQQIKILLYKSKYAQIIEEDSQLKIISDFKSQIKKADSPTKNVLESYLATIYWQYFQQNRYKFYNRTKTTSKVDSTDFRTWDLETLFSEIEIHFQNSLKNSDLLKQTKVEAFSDLLIEGKASKEFRPTLFDLLAHNALTFYETDENSITKPANKFIIDEQKYLEKAEVFKDVKIISADSSSSKLKTLMIFQELIKFHFDENNIPALIDADIDRLLFVKNNSTILNKDEVFINVLKESSQKFSSSEFSGLYDFELAKFYIEGSEDYNPKEAVTICNSVIKRFPKSLAAQKCEVLKSTIEKSTLMILSEDFLPIDKPSKLLVKHKNLNEISIQIYKVTNEQLRELDSKYRTDQQESFFRKLDILKTIDYKLTNELDYKEHTTEIVIPGLENGHYIFKADTDDEKSIFAFQSIQVTDFALVEKNEDENYIFQIINRLSGEPIVDANIAFSYQINGNQQFQNKSYSTDKKGQFLVEKSSEVLRNIKILVSKDKQKAYFDNLYIYRDNNSSQPESEQFATSIFTDRSIYRPGQFVYFKAIAFKTINHKSEVLPNEILHAILHDVKNQEVKNLELKTNEFGSVSGEFILPNNGLTGQYYIEIKGENKLITAETFFSVEEYKRPKFKAEFKPNEQTVQVNDSVTMHGNALSYAGSAITDAKVVYRVHRKVQLPIWYYWSRPAYNSEPQEITRGETTTDSEGNFEIEFKAIPDESVDKKNLPIFNYEVTAEVTDINGETRTATTIVNVGYHTTLVKIIMDEQWQKSKKDQKIIVQTENLNGEKVKSTGTLKIYKLIAPESVLRVRPWEAPDYKSLTKEEFKKLFPYEAYSDEDKPENWEKAELVFSEKFISNDSTAIILKNLEKWESGLYVTVAETEDSYGQLVKDEKRFYLIGSNDKKIADNQLLKIALDKDDYNINDKIEITIGSAAENLVVTIDVEKDHKKVETHIVNLKDEKKTITIPVEKNDLGGFAILYSYAYMNYYESGSMVISVPYPNSDLKIETMTFRDKLEPGIDETWEFKIKGPKDEEVSSELLASMYDLSLDQFREHQWSFDPLNKQSYFTYNTRSANRSFGTQYFRIIDEGLNAMAYPQLEYDELNWFGFNFGNFRDDDIKIRGMSTQAVQAPESLEEDVVMALSGKVSGVNIGDDAMNKNYDNREEENISSDNKNKTKTSFENISIRKNLEETAFFFPHLKTDSEGNISFSFKTPEALTSWKLQLLAHTKNLESKVTTLQTVTQKELMVIPNAPRFLREGDEIVISSKISNLSDKNLSGDATLILTDPFTGNDITNQILDLTSGSEVRNFSVDQFSNSEVSWTLTVPKSLQAVQYKIIAKAGEFSDGEQNALPVLTKRKLVTETLPMWVKSNESRTFTLDKLKNNTSSTLTNHKLTLEVTSNPAWYAVQSLPYLMEYPYDCNEQIFSRIYANSLASHIANSNPRIKEVFDQWASADVLISNLEKNEELKSILIEQTPWVRDAADETEQKKRIGLLFNINKMSDELTNAELKLQNAQLDNGAWAWFNGGMSNRFITQHIVTGFGHLDKLKAKPSSTVTNQMVSKALQYLDQEFLEEYKDLSKYEKKVDLTTDHLSYSQIHYLYMRSFFPQFEKSEELNEVMTNYNGQIKKYWLSKSLYSKGLMALISFRNNDVSTANSILKSLKENSVNNEELGMYWKENTNSWFWYQAPIETQSLMIEAFSEIGNDVTTVDNLKIWLLKNKQTNSWKTTKATSDATYALLLSGSDWLSVTESVDIELGGKTIDPKTIDGVQFEAGTGYFKTSWNSEEITKEMATVKMTKKGEGIAWASMYWQYFEDLDKITSAETPLQLTKKLFKRTYSDTGEVITQIDNSTGLKVGDLVRVRIELKVDRVMEYIHMQNMRASGLEPIDVISSYQYQDGLGYYQSTKDASTNFFFDYLPKGVYVFEYDLRVNNAGNMSNGITTIQSMYAPEFSSHSEGVRIKVMK
ncbi:Alpha-2-macroglobulin family protein [Flavobacteriaceae bacterium MAR_2010_188]|nr:Alpha-2-macroglobulin family protein [Flavobacteriaceae bacterium MAR_2010_188]